MNKNKNMQASAPMALLDRDAELQAAADAFTEGDHSDESLTLLRDRALAFADAVRACEGKTSR